MSTCIVHVLTIIGDSATEVEAACEDLLGRRHKPDDNGYGSDDWSKTDRNAIESLGSALISAARNLPVLHYAQYLDGWSVADSRFNLLKWPDGKRRQICADSVGMVFYPSGFSQDLLAQIGQLRRMELYRNQREDRWFVDQMSEAIEDALWLEAPFLVVSISECLGGSRHDEEIRAALNASIKLHGNER
jgi:hypothetical protein